MWSTRFHFFFLFFFYENNFLKDRERNMIFPPFPLQEIIEIDDHFRRFYSDDDNLNKAVSFLPKERLET